jgi:adenylyltransferase/sulfurtransferase
MTSNPLNAQERQRYARHLILPEIGQEGQERLKRSSVLLVGAGGLGAPAGMYLAAAGVGRLGLVDFDVVDASNLHRQVTYSADDVGRSKLQATRERLHGINPHVTFDLHEVRLDSSNALSILQSYDVIVDGTDNFATRYLVNDACVLLGKPDVYGSIFRFEGQVAVFWSARGPCYRCLFPQPPAPGVVPDCAEGGVLGVLPGIIGSLQASEALKILLGIGEPLIGRLLLYDALAQRTRELRLQRDPACVVCGDAPQIRELIDYDAFCTGGAVTSRDETAEELTASQLAARLDAGDAPAILDVREPFEWDICNLGRQGARLIPLGQLPQRLGELESERQRDIVVVCHTGVRSAFAVRLLRDAGFERVANLEGGMHSWAQTVDPHMPQY